MSKKQDKLNAMTYNTKYTVGDATSFREKHYLRLIEVLTARVADASFRGENYTLSQEDCSELKGAIRTHNGQDTLDAIEKSVQSVKLPKMIQKYIDNHVSEEDVDDVESDFLRYRDENKFIIGWHVNIGWISQREDMLREQDKCGMMPYFVIRKSSCTSEELESEDTPEELPKNGDRFRVVSNGYVRDYDVKLIKSA